MDKKALNLPILTSLVVGNMIGTGIYVLPASLAEFGSISLLAWVYTSLGALLLALTFVRLTKRFPKTGGPYVYCKEAYGRLAGFIIAYIYWLSNVVSIAGLAVASVGYLGYMTPLLNANTPHYSPYLALACELGIVWVFTAINMIGLHTAGVVQFFLTLIKIAPLIVITLVGLGSLHFANFTSFTVTAGTGVSSFNAFNSAAILTFWAFIGLEAATVPAENTRGARDIYKATIFGTLMTALLYISSSFVLMGMLPISELKSSQFPFAEAGTLLFGATAAVLIAVCAFISGLGSLNACTLIQGQIVFAAARDHLFPRMFAKLSKHDVPIAGQLLSASLVTVFLIMTVEPTLLKQFNTIALLAGLLTLLTYLATTLSEIKFLLQKGMATIFSKIMIIPFLATFYAVWMISSFNKNIIGITLFLILICIPIYFFVIRKYTGE